MQRLGNQKEWIIFWLGGKKSRGTSTDSIATTNNSPFFLSFDIIIGKEAQVVLVTFSQIMAPKMDEHIFYVKG